MLLRFVCIVLLVILAARESRAKCFGNGRANESTCVPEPRDAAKMSHRTVSSTSTCGDPPSTFCRLKPLNNCFKCNDSDPNTRHPVEYLADRETFGKATWWQSQSWWDWYQKYPDKDLMVNITMSFDKTYDLTGQILVNFMSPRPEKAVLEKSIDKGQTWTPIQYYAYNCLSQYGMSNTDPTIKRLLDFNVYCTEKYKDYTPLENGKVIFDFLTRYNEDNFFNRAVQNYLKATDLRFRLEYPGTNGLVGISKDQATLQQYFYAISDVEVVARCQCNGHAQWCDYPNFTGKNCDCQHHTSGDDCERCLPLYNNRTWMPATSRTEPNPCQKCECHNHADSCTYSQVHGYGVCDNCKHNTTGQFCEQCQDKFYRNVSLSLKDQHICPACNCFPQGITNNGTCHPTNGQCECRGNVTGRQCDSCADTFWGYTVPPIGHCAECRCNGNGTLNGSLNCDQYNSQCSCKPNVHMKRCSECRHGYYSFPQSIAEDCRSCNCDYGGSVLQICNKVNGDCICRKNIQGTRCTDIIRGHFTPNFAYLKYEAELAFGSYLPTSNTFDLDKYFTGTGYGSIRPGQFINFRVTVDMSWKWYIVLRYTDPSPGNDTLEIRITADATVSCSAVNLAVINVTQLKAGQGMAWMPLSPIALCKGQEYNVNVSYAAGALVNASIAIDSLVLMPEVKDSRVYRVAAAQGSAHNFDVNTISQCWNNWTTLQLAQQNQPICKNISFSVSAEVYDGAIACQCSSIGTVLNTTCDPYGGQCQCKPGVTGRTCDRCKPGFYDYTSQGCKRCSCSSVGSKELVCDPVTGQCPCKPGVITRTCSRCNDSYYGFTTGQGCVECRCNASGSADMQCDDITGDCTCKNSTLGQKCDECRFGFYNFTAAGCQECNCHVGGSKTLQCDLVTGVCPCKTNAVGVKCESCKNGTFNSDVNNPDGCKPCYCYGRSSTCTSAVGYTWSYISTDFTTGINRWTLTPEGTGMSPQQKSNGLEFKFTTSQNLTLGFNGDYLGNQLNSYGELLKIEIHYISVGPLLANWSLAVEGRGQTEVRFQVKPTPSTSMTSYSVRLHEEYATSVITARALQDIMADILTLKLRGEFRSNGSFILTKVQLHSATNDTTGVSVGHVENCACDAANYTGLSCELCNQGFTRTIPHTPRFGSCEVCRCTGRSTQCDEESGECQNCRTGSQGSSCETCQPGVDNTTDCTECLPEYWGLKPGSDGCRDCSCMLPNTLYGNNTVCNATTGQCSCKAKISGLVCDQCYDNAYNSTRGCIDCPECYRLLQDHVHQLRSEIASLDDLLKRVKNGDIGDVKFSQLLSNSVSTVSSIVSKASNSTGVEEKLYQELLTLNNTLTLIESTLKGAVTSDVTSLERVTKATQQDRSTTQQLIKQTGDLVIYGYNVLNTSMDVAVAQAHAVDGYLGGLVPRFASQAVMATAQATQQNTTGDEILRKTASAESLVTNADSLSVEAASRHNMTSQLLLSLQQLSNSVRTLGTETNLTAHALYANVTAVLGAASRALQAVNGLKPNNSAVLLEVQQTTAAAALNASGVVSRVLNLTQHYAAVVADTDAAVRSTGTVMATVRKQEAAGNEILAEARRALAEASTAVASASKTHADALEMRQILQTFEMKANESQRLAALALARAQEANQTSIDAINYAQKINASIQTTLGIANQALQMANTALGLAKTENQGVSTVHSLGVEMKQKADSSPHSPDSITSTRQNTTRVATNNRPAIANCTNYLDKANDAKPVSEEAEKLAQQASTNMNTAKQAVDRVLGDIPRLQTVNATRLAELQQEIQRLRTAFTSINVKTINTELRAAKEQQQVFIDQYKAKVIELRREVNELKALQRSLGVPPRGCS